MRPHGTTTRLAARPIRALALLAVVHGAGGCWESDNETFQRAWRAERRERIAGMRAATAEQARGTDVAGDDLRRLVSGRTH